MGLSTISPVVYFRPRLAIFLLILPIMHLRGVITLNVARFLLVFQLIAGSLFLAGCGSKIIDTGFLAGGYENFNVVDKRGFKVRLDDDFLAAKVARDQEPILVLGNGSPYIDDGVTTRPLVLILPQPEWRAEVRFEKQPAAEENILFTIRERLYRYMLRQYEHPVRVRYAYRRSDRLLQEGRLITVRTYVTHVKRGQGLLRYLLGYGLGQCYMQVEGEIFEGAREPKKIGEFAVRTAHGGYAQNGMNVAVIRDDYVLRYAAEEAVSKLTEFFPEYFEPIEKVRESEAQVAGASFNP